MLRFELKGKEGKKEEVEKIARGPLTFVWLILRCGIALGKWGSVALKVTRFDTSGVAGFVHFAVNLTKLYLTLSTMPLKL